MFTMAACFRVACVILDASVCFTTCVTLYVTQSNGCPCIRPDVREADRQTVNCVLGHVDFS